ncbi:DUF3562 domain-containing protein [Burkholderia ubonensis]|uniref:DUF3562 domain-containing protein n=1 Tax=Burkholderia ubonensis TaxID=101571 RepID=UPI00075A5C89|nr:DUF3562 domain-containing protein [Burkholderia ubonensis]AOI73346.1 hypothetical protein WI31_28155 [Burkholderia ubonensis]KUZ22005.1 hypothetical protein WI29_00330 [Burkholderia ubonensis]KUZ37202.1 hypothetical protein WI30_07470 [Burkholderia ubonensis]KUZ41930.1 hypothetical protein WI32_03520 [Burkholderia ubonensis]KUZ53936.1 hypothetical protein WI33_10160 [Burkholderia ubonensis]
MSRDTLLEALAEAAAQRSINADQLRAMIDDEVRALSSDARVHDYIHVFAVRHLRERMRQLDEQAADESPARQSAEPDVQASRRL